MKNLRRLTFTIVALLVANVPLVSGDEKTKKAARAVIANNQEAVITVVASGTVDIEMDGKKTKFNVETTGTVLTEDGLTICDPSRKCFSFRRRAKTRGRGG